ncbi:MAG: radical SAM protein [Myxococcales bacterium]|nr:radical SAM protein [Myxococcales bacterium]
MARPHLYAQLPEDLTAHLGRAGVALDADEARRLMAAAFDSRPPKQPLSKAKLEAVERELDATRLELLEKVENPSDRFVKYLFRSPDGALSEAVRIPLEKPGRFSVCLSSQVGCAMACQFCATGRLGLSRNLETWEMVSAFLRVRDEAPGRVVGAVFQGQGEPLQNYDAVIQAARVLSHPCGARVSGRSITISTVGLAPQIRRFAAERHPYRLIVSLTSALEERRKRLLPVAGKVSLEELARAVHEYAAVAKHGRLTLAMVLMSGVNTDAAEVREIQRLFGDLDLRINLIDVNDPRPDGFRRASDAERKAFMSELQVLKAPIVRRYSGGAEKHAACGMLAAERVGCA